MNKQLYAKIIEGDLKGRILKVTGRTKSNLTVEYVEECFSLTEAECLPFINGETLTWEQYRSLVGDSND